MKKFIGLGCSWAAGEGGYPTEIFQKFNGRCNVGMASEEDAFLRPYELQNSWVAVMCREYLKDYIPVNLGERGVGIRGAVNQMFLTDEVDWENDSGIICLLLPHPSRTNVFCKHRTRLHYNWHTIWPSQGHTFDPKVINTEGEWWDYIWMTRFYDEYMACHEAAMAIYSAQVFAERYNFKFVFANGYMEKDSYKNYFEKNEVKQHLIDRIDWSNYFPTKNKSYDCFMDKLIELDNIVPEDQHYYSYYQNLPWPGTYLTNCIHPTIEGYKFIAQELYSFIKYKNYV